MIKLGVISGSGLDYLSDDGGYKTVTSDSPYGKPSSDFRIYKIGNLEIYNLARHGDNHNINPTNINYRANIDAFKNAGVDKIIAFASSGAINKTYPLGSLVLSDNAIDHTYNRANSFYDKEMVTHIDLSYPFCDNLRAAIISGSKKSSVELITNSTAICTEGPRIETAAEINYFKIIGADTVGMTLFPEVALAREHEICYSSIAIVSNYAAGINDVKITACELQRNVAKAKADIKKILHTLEEFIGYKRDCACADALKGATFNG